MPKHRDSILENPVHLIRWMKAQAAGGDEDAAARAVAKSEHISVETAKRSIRHVEIYRKKNERVEFDLAIRDLVISVVPQAKETLSGLLAATELVEVTDNKTGKKRVQKMEDKTTRLEALRVVKELVAVQQPKAPLVEQNIQQNQNTQVAAIGNGETFEERMRRLREKARAANMLPPETIGVPREIDSGEESDDGDDEEAEEEETE